MFEDENEVYEYMFVGIDRDIKTMITAIKFRRLEKGYSQRDLARITGIKQSAIARLEANKLCPRLDTIFVIARALDLQVTLKRISTGWAKSLTFTSKEEDNK
jgi:predicted transcriptional regulator